MQLSGRTLARHVKSPDFSPHHWPNKEEDKLYWFRELAAVGSPLGSMIPSAMDIWLGL